MKNFKHAFTLAEVLITLAIIGVVAAMTLPVLIQNINEHVYAEREANIAFKINQAMESMRSHGLLSSKFTTTEAFVDELSNYLKIAKRCNSDNIASCWPTTKITDTNGEEYDVSKAKTGKDLQLKTSTTNNVGIVLADGAALILNYNPESASEIDVGDAIKASGDSKVGGKYYTTNLTAGLAYVTDVNGKSGPNSQEANKRNDIRSFNGAAFGTGCQGTKVDGKCVYQISSYTSVTDPSRSSFVRAYGFSDYWQGAIDACEAIGMKLPDKDELQDLAKNKTWEGKPTSGEFWSSSEGSDYSAWYVDILSGIQSDDSKSYDAPVLCVGK